MVNWVDSIIEKIRSTGMVKLECIGFIFIPSQISVVKICANFYPSFSNITLSYIEFTQKTFVLNKMLHSSPFIEFYSSFIKKKKNVSQIQDKSLFVVTLFGDSKRVYDVKGL